MNKFALLLVIMILTGLSPFKQSLAGNGPKDPMSKESWTLNFGVGPGVQYYSGYSSSMVPAFHISFETGMWQLGPGVLTLGGETGLSYTHYAFEDYSLSGVKYPGPTYSWLTFIVAARSAYHYSWNVEGLDTYGGLSAGMRFLSFTMKDNDGKYYSEPDYNPVYPYFGVFVGGSYFFTQSLGVNAEFGYNLTLAQIGLIFKLR